MRSLLLAICAVITFGCAFKAGAEDHTSAPAPMKVASDMFLELETYRLWTGRAEGATGDGVDETPTITVFTPQKGFSNGSAVVVAPGGAYTHLAGSIEGRQVGDWFASRGMTAFVLKYRVGVRARLPIPLNDGARAMRFARANAAFFHIDPARIGMIGFSAGGHLSAMTAALANTRKANAADFVDRVSSRPDFLILGYPWLEGTIIDSKSSNSQYCLFARVDCNPRKYESYAPIRLITGDMPPTFIYHTTNDGLVPVEGSWRFYEALKAKGVPVEMHLFESGPHGTGLGGSNEALARWPELLEQWLRANMLFGGPPSGGSKGPAAPPKQ